MLHMQDKAVEIR